MKEKNDQTEAIAIPDEVLMGKIHLIRGQKVMLSSVLSSKRAIQVNIRVMRIYVRIREMTMLHRDILQRIEGIEGKLTDQDNQFLIIFEYIKQFEEIQYRELEQKNRPKIGFKKPGK